MHAWRRGMPVTYACCSMADCLAMLAPCAARSRAMARPQQPSEDSPSRRILVSMCLRRHARGDEAMLALSRSQIILPPVKYQACQGDTNGGAIGPVVLAPPKLQWQATRADKKLIFGPGRKPAAKAPRTDDLVEPVFFHSMPVTCLPRALGRVQPERGH